MTPGSLTSFTAATMTGSAIIGVGLGATEVAALTISAPIITGAAAFMWGHAFESTYGERSEAISSGVIMSMGGNVVGATSALIAAGLILGDSAPEYGPHAENDMLHVTEMLKAKQISVTPADRAGIAYKTPGYKIGG